MKKSSAGILGLLGLAAVALSHGGARIFEHALDAAPATSVALRAGKAVLSEYQQSGQGGGSALETQSPKVTGIDAGQTNATDSAQPPKPFFLSQKSSAP